MCCSSGPWRPPCPLRPRFVVQFYLFWKQRATGSSVLAKLSIVRLKPWLDGYISLSWKAEPRRIKDWPTTSIVKNISSAWLGFHAHHASKYRSQFSKSKQAENLHCAAVNFLLYAGVLFGYALTQDLDPGNKLKKFLSRTWPWESALGSTVQVQNTLHGNPPAQSFVLGSSSAHFLRNLCGISALADGIVVAKLNSERIWSH